MSLTNERKWIRIFRNNSETNKAQADHELETPETVEKHWNTSVTLHKQASFTSPKTQSVSNKKKNQHFQGWLKFVAKCLLDRFVIRWDYLSTMTRRMFGVLKVKVSNLRTPQ